MNDTPQSVLSGRPPGGGSIATRNGVRFFVGLSPAILIIVVTIILTRWRTPEGFGDIGVAIAGSILPFIFGTIFALVGVITIVTSMKHRTMAATGSGLLLGGLLLLLFGYLLNFTVVGANLFLYTG